MKSMVFKTKHSTLRCSGVRGCFVEMSDFIYFWARCFKGGFDFAVAELAYLDGFCIAIGLLLVLRRNKKHRHFWEQFLEGLVRKYAGILILAQCVLSVFFVAPYIQFHDEQIKNLAQVKEVPKIIYVNSVTNANQATILQGVLSSNLIVSPDYSTKNFFGDTNRPELEIGIVTNLQTQESEMLHTNQITVVLSKSRQIDLALRNAGAGLANRPVLEFAAITELDPTNVYSEGWGLRHNYTFMKLNGETVKFNRWSAGAADGFIGSTHELRPNSLIISTNYSAPAFDSLISFYSEQTPIREYVFIHFVFSNSESTQIIHSSNTP